jgi:uncharacterized repeat protein (TIGR01451 family)
LKQILFNKRRFLSLIVGKDVFTFVSSSKNSLKLRPMIQLLKTSSHPTPRPLGLMRALLLLAGMMACLAVNAQGWEIYFGGNNDDLGQSIIQTQDFGFVGVGSSESTGAGNNYKAYVIRTDVDGTEIWSNTYDDGFISHGYSITETPDHGFLVAGDIRATQLSDANIYLLKINAAGQKQWNKQFGNTNNDELGYRIIPTTASGGYLLVGTTTNIASGERDVYLLKLDAQGDQVWSNTYGPSSEDDGWAVLEVADGYLVAGNAINPVNGTKDGYLLKLDFNGNELWSKFYGSPTDIDQLLDLELAADGNVALAGHTGSTSEGWLLKTDLDGNLLWSKTFGGPLGDLVNDLAKVNNGDLVVTGVTEIDAANSDAFLARFDNDGNQIWTNNIGRGSHVDVGQAVTPTADGGFIVIGYNALFSIFFNDVTFIKASADGSVYTNRLTGKVFVDDGDCILQAGEQGLNDWIVKAESDTRTFFGTTDADGNYEITLDSGDYEVSVFKKNDYWEACILAYSVTFSTQYGSLVRNFPMLKVVDCPLLNVDISAPVAQNCSNIGYAVSYCNTGTAPATNPSVNVILDNGLTYVGSSIPLASQNDSLLVFELDTLGLDECGSFTINVTSDCNGLPAEAYIVSAHILPDSFCLPVSPNWDMASIEVNGFCDTDSIEFRIKNKGTGDMQAPKGFIVIEDHILGFEGSFTLLAGQDTRIALPSNGATYRIIAEQSEGHPGDSYPTVAVEGCTTTGTYSTGFVTELQEDENDPFVAVDAQENISSFTDYIILRGYPKGYQQNGENLIPANTDIEYHVFFQNVSMDTITRLVIRDTLSPFLDLGTVTAGSSSHPYDFELNGDGTVRFTFTNLQLLPGGGAGSEGFVKFKVSQKADNPTGTQITNSATVFLGYDVPKQTASYTHTIGGKVLLDFIVISDVEDGPERPGVAVSAYPNPFASTIDFEAKTLNCNNLNINVFDINGRLVRQENAPGNRLRLLRNGMPAGVYNFQLEADGKLIHTGKIVVR